MTIEPGRNGLPSLFLLEFRAFQGEISLNYIKSKQVLIYFITAIVTYISGYVFYILVRGFDPLQLFDVGVASGIHLPIFINSSYATFTHAFALSLFCYALLGAKQQFRLLLVLFWSVINLIFEFLQLTNNNFLISGTYDNLDVVAILLAAVSYLVFTNLVDNKFSTNIVIHTRKSLSLFGLPIVGLIGIISIMASSAGNYEINNNEPVYLSYEKLRAKLKIETVRPLQKAGKIYLYQDLLLVSEPNKGIHIYNNADPVNPDHKAFINLPGNLDIAVRNGYLYADSFIDLVTIDIRDLNNIVEMERVVDVFPYNQFQAVSRKELGIYAKIDRNKGVVIGVIKKPRLVFDQ